MLQPPDSRSPLDRAASLLGVLHPPLFAAAYVLDRFAFTNSVLPEIVRPLLVLVVGAAAATLLLWAVLRNRYLGALIASTLVLVLVLHPIPALVMVVLLTWCVGVGAIRRRHGSSTAWLRSTDLPVRLASAYAIVLLAAGIWASADAFTTHVAEPPTLPSGSGTGGPNIYVLLLDGYPRSDTLAALGYDNTEFEGQLAALGFSVSSEARSNHNKTWLTVATMLNGQYIADLPEIAQPPSSAPNQVRLVHALIDHGAVLTQLRGRGYEVVSIPSAVMSTDVTSNAEVWNSPHLNQFEVALVSASLPAFVAPGLVLDFLVTDARAEIDDQLDALVDRAGDGSATPKLVWTHLMSPHPPFILGQDPGYLRGCFPACKVWETTLEETGLARNAYAERLIGQVRDLNRKVITAIGRVVSADPSAIFIVMSDHGARLRSDPEEEHFRILFAGRSPNHPDLFPTDVTPVNALRQVLSSVADVDVRPLPYQRWASDWFLPLKLTRESR